MSSEKKAEIGKRAAEHGVLATVHYYASRLPEPLKESSVRTWKNAYTAQLQKQRREGKYSPKVEELPTKKRGRPNLLREDLELQVRAYLKALHANGAVVTTAITIRVAEGIIRNKDSNLLAANGGHIALRTINISGVTVRPGQTRSWS